MRRKLLWLIGGRAAVITLLLGSAILIQINAPGSLADIAQVVAANDANIHTLSMIRTAPDFTEMLIDLEVWDLKHLNRLLSQLKENASVSDARRVNG